MTKKKIWLGMLALVLTFGMMVVGCDDGSDDGGGGSGKSITITGITGIPTGYNEAMLLLFSSLNEEGSGAVAAGSAQISGTSVTISLLDMQSSGRAWNGSGSYYLGLGFNNTANEDDQIMYFYTNGQTLAQLGLSSTSTQAQIQAALPKFNVSSDSSTIAFNKFVEW